CRGAPSSGRWPASSGSARSASCCWTDGSAAPWWRRSPRWVCGTWGGASQPPRRRSPARDRARSGAQAPDVRRGLVAGIVVVRSRRQLGEQLPVDREVALATDVLELTERLLELAATGADELVELAVEPLEARLHLVHLGRVL